MAVDHQGIYGGDAFCMKAAAHELKGLVSLYHCGVPQLNVPMMCLVDYRGYRLIAMSILPLQRLVYGSDNYGECVYNCMG